MLLKMDLDLVLTFEYMNEVLMVQKMQNLSSLHSMRAKNIVEITKMGKEPIVAVIERRGEIIYYKINKMNFSENTPELQMKDFEFN